MANSLFGYLAQRFTSSPENLATESLLYILHQSSIAKRAFFRFLMEQTGCLPLPENLRLTSQYTDKDDQSTPDLVGFDEGNRPIFICESKFWAGLTENQPITYLEQLERAAGHLLLIIGPSKRINILWAELTRRVKSAGYHLEQKEQNSKHVETALINGKYVLAFASWQSLLSVLSLALQAEGEQTILGDLKQLQGLCDQMDSSAFLPLRSQELTSNIGQRISHYCDLVDESIARLGRDGICKLEGLRASGSRGWYGRYVHIHHYGCLLQFNANFWAKYSSTPIWLSIQDTSGEKWGYAANARIKLARYEQGNPTRLFQDGDLLLVPIYLPVGVEKAEVIGAIYQQVKELYSLLADHNQSPDEEHLKPPTAQVDLQ
jgi:hypothetical protein